MSEIRELYLEYVKSPCYSCDMTALLHYHTAEDAENFKFGCSGKEFDNCYKYRRERLIGPDGARGIIKSGG
jgi:hypothetical protein